MPPSAAPFWLPPPLHQGDAARRGRTQRYRVVGRNHYQHFELGFFSASSPYEACGMARRVKGHLCGGLRLEASEQ